MTRRRISVTIKHVAADAGVSHQTVSRVINNEPFVRPEMQRRVQASIDKLGYVPSIDAQRMRGARSRRIVALNDRERTIADWRDRQGADWLGQMMLGGMLTCAEHGYRRSSNWSTRTATISSASFRRRSRRSSRTA